MRQKGPYKCKNEKFHFTPKDHLDRIIFEYKATPATSDKKWFEGYLDERNAVFDDKREYAAMHNSLRLYNNICKQAERKGFSFRQAIPLQVQQDVEELRNKMLDLSEGFQFNEEGWLYVYSNYDSCLYVGQTRDSFPLREATSHLGSSNSNRDWSRYLQEQKQNYYDKGWNIKFIRPGDCEQLIRKSFFLPNENYDNIMLGLEEAYQEKRISNKSWWLDRAERVLITVLDPKYNKMGKRRK